MAGYIPPYLRGILPPEPEPAPPEHLDEGWTAEPPPEVAAELEREGGRADSGSAPKRQPLTVPDVLAQWKVDGPLVHEPTGLAALDAALGGGPVYGSRGIVQGAPDAAKTLLLVAIADAYARRGIAVGIHAVDEEASDVVTRLMQRRSFHRTECETRGDIVDLMGEKWGGYPLHIYDGTWTIEEAAADLASRGERCAYFGDSIQTLTSERTKTAEASGRELGPREAVTANMCALRSVATKHKLIAIGTSELNRNSYRNEDSAETTNDMAAGAESRAIEYQSRWLVSLRSVKGEANLIHCRIAKNKFGPSGGAIFFALDRARQTLTQADAPPEVDREAAKVEKSVGARVRDAALVAAVLADGSGPHVGALYPLLAGAYGSFSKDRAAAAVAKLGAAVVRVPAPKNGLRVYLDGSLVAADVLEAVDVSKRPRVIAARPPAEESKGKRAKKPRAKLEAADPKGEQ